jgi:NADH-quinone oxidoreductase subunit K
MPAAYQILMFTAFLMFGTGVSLVVFKKHLLSTLVGIELMLNAANLNLIMWSYYSGAHIQILILFIIALAVCETALALSLIYYHRRKSGLSFVQSGI